ncbi:hypothetical protein HWI79_1752 [Cryptosporidium felis]|nr:hypothetical protein HWI79_1752 [Cryptosporidium felis]
MKDNTKKFSVSLEGLNRPERSLSLPGARQKPPYKLSSEPVVELLLNPLKLGGRLLKKKVKVWSRLRSSKARLALFRASQALESLE